MRREPDTSEARLAVIDNWAEGSYPDGKPHIPEDCESFTRDLLAIIRKERAARVRACDECHA